MGLLLALWVLISIKQGEGMARPGRRWTFRVGEEGGESLVVESEVNEGVSPGSSRERRAEKRENWVVFVLLLLLLGRDVFAWLGGDLE